MKPFKLDYRPFPAECRGAVTGMTCLCGGQLQILIDSTAPAAEQAETLRHELSHIALDHFDDTNRSIQQIEAEADSYAEQLTDADVAALMQWCTNQ